MEPWEIAEHLIAAGDQENILKGLKQTDSFWIGASYAVDPFVGVIYKLPLRDPYRHEHGLSASIFDQVVKAILSGDLRGDPLARAVEKISQACREPEWRLWYRRILEGTLDLRIPLALFNKYCPTGIAPPALNKSRPLAPSGIARREALPARFFVQPLYEGRCFWLLDSRTDLIEVRGYDEHCVRLHDPHIETSLTAIGRKNPVNVVILGFLDGALLVEDLLTHDQFTRESSAFPLRHRLEAAEKLGLPLVQRSPALTEFDKTFFDEIGLIFEQRYKGAVVRDLDGSYPFRVQCDFKLAAKSWVNNLE